MILVKVVRPTCKSPTMASIEDMALSDHLRTHLVLLRCCDIGRT